MTSTIVCFRDGRFGSKVGQIDPKWDKSGAFSDQISATPTIPGLFTGEIIGMSLYTSLKVAPSE